MRLIDTSTLTLKEFPTSNQRYAILSHTWGADGEEVSYQDMTAHVVSEATKKKPGWRKIEKTCELARTHHGLQLAWIDTCCIDKRSSAELSEAINSMFRWYQEAETCFAFLSDVTWDPLNSLHQSRWFTRGWTLQELIAPKNVAFFNSDWTLFGTKASLTSELAFKTGIPRGILLHEITLDDVPVAARMSWASMRETTREEDLAYCLLGLFDIHMPMLYGEGRKAFLRLQEEIMRRTADMSIFLWTDPDSSRTYSGLLAETPAHFRYMQTVVQDPLFNSRDFSLTNRGIRIEVPLALEPNNGLSILPLNHGFPGVKSVGIYVRKVGADLFVRVHPAQHVPMENLICFDEVFQVAKTLTPAQSDAIHRNVLRITMESPECGLLYVEPKGCWSSTNNLLYAGYTGSFIGYLEFGKEGEQPLTVLCCFKDGTWYCGVVPRRVRSGGSVKFHRYEGENLGSLKKEAWSSEFVLCYHTPDGLQNVVISVGFNPSASLRPKHSAELILDHRWLAPWEEQQRR